MSFESYNKLTERISKTAKIVLKNKREFFEERIHKFSLSFFLYLTNVYRHLYLINFLIIYDNILIIDNILIS